MRAVYVALLVMWVAPIIEGSRLEIALRTASEEVAAALEAESAQPVAVAIAVESAEPEMTAASVAMA